MIKNFIVDRVVRGNMYNDKTGELLWSLNQIQSPSLTMESESVDAVDALGTPIMSFDRSKSCTLSAENAIFDLSLLGEQVGSAAKTETRLGFSGPFISPETTFPARISTSATGIVLHSDLSCPSAF